LAKSATRVHENFGNFFGKTVVYLAVLAAMAALAISKERRDSATLNAEQHRKVEALAETLADDLTQVMADKFVMASGLAGAISLVPDISQQQFSSLASSVTVNDTSVVNIASIRDFTIVHVFPTQDNAGLIGRSIAEVPEQRRAAERARDTRSTILQGPIRLLQGYEGFIIREPIFFRRANLAANAPPRRRSSGG